MFKSETKIQCQTCNKKTHYYSINEFGKQQCPDCVSSD